MRIGLPHKDFFSVASIYRLFFKSFIKTYFWSLAAPGKLYVRRPRLS